MRSSNSSDSDVNNNSNNNISIKRQRNLIFSKEEIPGKIKRIVKRHDTIPLPFTSVLIICIECL